jgi:Uma2 family endonuclease
MVANLKSLPRHYYTLEEYFALEKAGEARYEYWDGDIVCMSGGTPKHYILTSNIHLKIGQQLEGKKCQSYTEGIPIKTPKLPPYRYADMSVVCGESQFENMRGIYALVNPLLVVEVLSSTTEEVDKNEKRIAYQALKSLQEYLLVAQDAPQITQYIRQGNFWVVKDYSDLSEVIELPSIKGLLSLAAVYNGVAFDIVE